MSKKKLFDDDSEEDIALKTENEYAKKYDTWREKEELHKLEQKYGHDALKSDGSDGSDSEDDSDDAPEVSEEVEEQFLKTLALLKTKDPRIYDPSFKCFDQEEEKKTEEKPKPKTLTFDDSDDDEDEGGDIFKIEKKAEIDDSDSERTTSTKVPKGKKEKKIKEYLTGKAEHVDEQVERDLAPLRALWADPALSSGEAFLRDYILNKRYLEDGDEGSAADRLRDDAALEADEQTVEEQSKFERAYNFRFEEPDDEYLKRFPRTMSSIRPKDDRRSRHRAELRARKLEEKKRKMDEIARLKALKLKEIQDKLARVKEVTGNEELGFKPEDLEGDFDPEEHDRRMRALFDDQYYGEADSEKPVFPDLDDELEIENWDKYDVDADQPKQERDDEPHCEDDDFNMDADYDPKKPRAGLLEEIQKTLGKKRRNRKKKSKLAEILSVEKPKFIPEVDKSYDKYMEEYYKMDCEDIVGGDLPTRFKYREVVPNDYGLTVEEILLADDRELTQWVPLKKVVKYRPEHLEKGEVKTYAARAQDLRLKRKMLPSLYRDLPEEPELVVPVEEGLKKKKKKKKKNKEKTEEIVETAEDVQHDADMPEQGNDLEQETEVDVKLEEKRKKKKNKQKHVETDPAENTRDSGELPEKIDENNVKADNKRKKNKKKKSETNAIEKEQEESRDKTIREIDNVLLNNEKSRNKDKDTKSDEGQHNVSEQLIETDNVILASEGNSKKKQKRNRKNVNGDTFDSISNYSPNKDGTNKLVAKTNNHKANAFVIEEVSAQGPSQESALTGKGLKRKLEMSKDSIQHKKKKKDIASKGKGHKFSQKDKFKNKNKLHNKQNKDTSNENPLSKLSDERLKAYGLNPKKYKNFLKYKKF